MRVFVPDGSQFIIRWYQKHSVELSDDRRQVRRLIAGVELQDGRLKKR